MTSDYETQDLHMARHATQFPANIQQLISGRVAEYYAAHTLTVTVAVGVSKWYARERTGPAGLFLSDPMVYINHAHYFYAERRAS